MLRLGQAHRSGYAGPVPGKAEREMALQALTWPDGARASPEQPRLQPLGACHVKILTALATTRLRIATEISDCSAMVSLAQAARGMTSVGLKANAFVRPRYR